MKVHIYNSDSPLTDGVNTQAICNDLIPKAVAVAQWSADDPTDLAVPRLCRRCKEAAAEHGLQGTYVYSIIPGQESMLATD